MSKTPTIRKSRKVTFKSHFVQDGGSYLFDTAVFVAMDFSEVMKNLKRYHRFEEWRERFEGDHEAQSHFEQMQNHGCVFFHNGMTILWLQSWTPNEFEYDILAHECHHVVHGVLFEYCNIHDAEALAHHFQFLFGSIRKRLNEEALKWKKKSKK